MSVPSSEAMDEITDADGRHDEPGRPRHCRRGVIAGVLTLVVAAGVVVWVADPFNRVGHSSGVPDNAAGTSLATVTRQSLLSQTNVDATLGYAGSFAVVNQATGIITALPSIGQIIKQGHTLYEVGGLPVVLLRGSTPAYRSLSQGMSGADVRQLNAALVALGYAKRSELHPSSEQFVWRTGQALEELQAHLGIAQTGTLALGQAVFLPTSAARITAESLTPGALAGPGASILLATSTTRRVTIDLDAAQQSTVKVGDKVIITLPSGKTTPGVVSEVGTVATTPASGSSGGSGSPTVTVEVTLTHPAASGRLDQAPVLVGITMARVKDALVVPVTALLALADGGYAVEVVPSGGAAHRLVPVTVGLFDDADGLVQVTGSGLSAGQHVVVPAT